MAKFTKAQLEALVAQAGDPSWRGATAVEAYASKRTLVSLLVEALGEQLELHAAKAAAAPRNWGYVGDLGHAGVELAQLVASFAGVGEFAEEAK